MRFKSIQVMLVVSFLLFGLNITAQASRTYVTDKLVRTYQLPDIYSGQNYGEESFGNMGGAFVVDKCKITMNNFDGDACFIANFGPYSYPFYGFTCSAVSSDVRSFGAMTFESTTGSSGSPPKQTFYFKANTANNDIYNIHDATMDDCVKTDLYLSYYNYNIDSASFGVENNHVKVSWVNSTPNDRLVYQVKNVTTGSVSPWITGTSWVDTNTSAGIQYTYQVLTKHVRTLDTETGQISVFNAGATIIPAATPGGTGITEADKNSIRDKIISSDTIQAILDNAKMSRMKVFRVIKGISFEDVMYEKVSGIEQDGSAKTVSNFNKSTTQHYYVCAEQEDGFTYVTALFKDVDYSYKKIPVIYSDGTSAFLLFKIISPPSLDDIATVTFN